MRIHSDELISISDMSAQGVSLYVTKAEQGQRWFLTRYGKPVAVLLGADEYEKLAEAAEARGTVAL
jgi:prevent-host-death family protein